jgi:hypothetical protein
MASTTLREIAILKKQTTMVLFIMLEDQLVLDKVQEYFKLQRYEMLQKLQLGLKINT